MDFDPHLIADIDSGENCDLTAYKDTEGLWTIGWGHLLEQSIDWTGHTITQAQADAWRDADMQEASHEAQRMPEWVYMNTACRRNAFIELMFNLGPAKWLRFIDTRGAIRAGNWRLAHDELLDSKWAGQVKARRANRLANYLLTGQYPA